MTDELVIMLLIIYYKYVIVVLNWTYHEFETLRISCLSSPFCAPICHRSVLRIFQSRVLQSYHVILFVVQILLSTFQLIYDSRFFLCKGLTYALFEFLYYSISFSFVSFASSKIKEQDFLFF